jgi:5-methylcytosine-specific restriction protein A
MPYKPKRPCSHPGCPNLTDGRYCEVHAKEAARAYERNQRDPGTQKHYGSLWRKARKKFLDEHLFLVKFFSNKNRMDFQPITDLPFSWILPLHFLESLLPIRQNS